jgi:hypothetical protein
MRCLLNILLRSHCHLAGLLLCAVTAAYPQNVLRIDATAPASKPQPVQAQLGTSIAPDGQTLTVNSRYLMLNGKPWLPVMGEFHYSRVPEREWEDDILKMKADGVQVISTYVIWIHQEEVEGQFDWSGRRNLRRFVELCAKHGMYVYPRIGPWVHAEVRNGGLPDWVLHNSPVRTNNPVYLREVRAYYDKIGQQLNGLLWKDNGPVIGIQIENEYHIYGPGSGAAHIRKLKQLALQAGLDVPLYTVTGWDGAAIPLDQVLPVYGGYPDAPWDRHFGKLPPSEIFAFRFHNRAAGSMGAIGSHGQNSSAAYRGTPFLTAEIGGGMEDTYFRRPVIHADDIASLAPVMLGSGANLLGYYMFQGGRNPQSRLTTLQESQRTGYPTDVPVRSYDFQAPLGEFGQERESFRRMKLLNYFLEDYGAMLAPMTVAAPAEQPASPSDLSVARVSARVSGDQAFLFFNNYVRGAAMPARPGFQIHLHLPAEELSIPDRPITVPSGAYGIWPVNLNLHGHNLIYSTAQIFTHVRFAGEDTYFFFAIPGIPPEFAFASTESPKYDAHQITMSQRENVDYLHCASTRTPVVVTLPHTAAPIRIVLLSRAAAEQVWTVDGRDTLIRTPDEYFSDDGTVHLLSNGNTTFRFGLLGASQPTAPEAQKSSGGTLFLNYTATVAAVHAKVQVKFLHAAQQPAHSPALSAHPVPYAPIAKDFTHAAAWSLHVSYPVAPQLSNVFLRLTYTGDVARLYFGKRLLDDNFWNGTSWELGMQPWKTEVRDGNLQLRILPAPSTARIADTGQGSEAQRRQAALLQAIVIPQYQLTVQILPHPAK